MKTLITYTILAISLSACGLTQTPQDRDIPKGTPMCQIDAHGQAVRVVVTQEEIAGDQMLVLVETWDKNLLIVKVDSLTDSSACDSLRWK